MGALKGLLELDLKLNVCFAFAVVENSCDARSYRPSDIIMSKKGVTVEVMNTDAEGRLILADTLWHITQTYRPKYTIDLATLTGTIITALGNHTCGVFTNDEEFCKDYVKKGNEMHERSWHMPIFDDHIDEIKNDVSDLRNMGDDRLGHSNRAAAFIQEFVGDKTKWIHVDLAGPTYLDTARPPLPKYCTGFGTQTLLNIFRRY